MKLSFSPPAGARRELVLLGLMVTALEVFTLERMVTGDLRLAADSGLVTMVTAVPDREVRLSRLIRSEGSRGSMSMLSSLASVRLSKMLVTAASAPPIAWPTRLSSGREEVSVCMEGKVSMSTKSLSVEPYPWLPCQGWWSCCCNPSPFLPAPELQVSRDTP